MFEAVYIADKSNNLIYEYRLNLSSPPFCSLQSLLNDDSSIIEVNSDYYLVSSNSSSFSINILCASKSKLHPMFPLEFIDLLIIVINDYFSLPLSIPKIQSNNDTLTLLLTEMLESSISDSNQLRDLVSYKSFMSKILNSSVATSVKNVSVIGGVSRTGLKSPSPEIKLASSTPWRRSNVKYTNNEMYVDIIETIDVLLKPIPSQTKLVSSYASAFYNYKPNNTKLVIISGIINGKIDLLSHLTGIPELFLSLRVPKLDSSPSFHQCIDLNKWNQNKSLSFIPPDGQSTLMNYQLNLGQKSTDLLGLIEIDYQSGLGNLKNEFELKLIIQDNILVKKIENLSLQIVCKYSEDDDSVKPNSITSIKLNRLTHGDFTYKGKGKAEWNLRSINTGTQPVLRASLFTNDIDDNDDEVENLQPLEPIHFKLNYDHKGCVPSGLKVDSLKIVSSKGMPEGVKPYKGVKYITKTGDFIIRS